MRKSKRRGTVELTLQGVFLDRLDFLAPRVGAIDYDDLIRMAVHYFDRAVGAAIDGGRVVVRHRDGRVEDMQPKGEWDDSGLET